MALLHSFESQGNRLFKYRGQIPVVLFLAAIPAIYFTDYRYVTAGQQNTINVVSLIFCVLGFWVRFYTIATTPKGTSGRNTDKQVAEALNTTGIYSLVRHPLYLGNFLAWMGIVIYTMSIPFIIIVSLAYWIYYERIMFAEERFLERKFGQAFLDWTERVPAIIPSFSGFVKSSVPFSLVSILRREYSGVLATVTGFAYIELVKNYFRNGTFFLERNWVTIIIATTALALILKILKNYTRVLSEEGRS